MDRPPQEDIDLIVLSHLTLRRALGVLGLFLPVVLITASILGIEPIRSSISAYYYVDGLGHFFTGTLWAIGVFLLFYRGYKTIPSAFTKLPTWLQGHLTDAKLTSFAGLCALVTAIVPTCNTACVAGEGVGRFIHLTAAMLFLFTLAVMAIWVFTASDTPAAKMSSCKKWENRAYVAMGVLIFLSLAAALIVLLSASDERNTFTNALFWIECVAITAFGVAWLIKGKVIEGMIALRGKRNRP